MEWKAEWIWIEPVGRRFSNCFVYFRKRVIINEKSKIIKSLVHIFADSRYILYVNGIKTGRGPAPFDPRHIQYDTYDIAEYLQNGENVIGVIVCHYGECAADYFPGRAEFILQCDIYHADGNIENIITDESWKCSIASCWQHTPRKSVFKSLFEVFDSRQYKDDWNTASFDDSGWYNAVSIGDAWRKYYEIKPREIAGLKYFKNSDTNVLRWGGIKWEEDPLTVLWYMLRKYIVETAADVKILDKGKKRCAINPNQPDSSTYVIFDFGKLVCGRLNFILKAHSGTVVDIIFREDDQKPYFGHNILMPLNRTHNITRYICREGLQEWEVFDYDAYRYVQLIVHNGDMELVIEDIWVDEQRYPAEFTGSFECSDMQINRLWKASKNTIELCLQDNIPDNVSREKAPWTGDIELAKLPVYYLTADKVLTRHSLISVSHGISKEGKMKCCWPSGLVSDFWDHSVFLPDEVTDYMDRRNTPATEIPLHSLLFVTSLWRHYFHTGDKELLLELYPKAMSIMKWMESHSNSDGLLNGEYWGDRWDYMDWEGTREPWIPLNFFYLEALHSSKSISDELGYEEDSAGLAAKIKKLSSALVQHSWNEKYGAFVDCYYTDSDGNTKPWFSEHTLSQALMNGLVPEQYIRHVADKMAYGVEDGSLVFKYYPYMALSLIGKHQTVLEQFRNKWIKMKSVNETNTIQEVWDMDSEECLCVLCQSAGAVPAYYLPAYILGVRPLKPAFEEFIIEPVPVDLKWAKGVVPTPKGQIKIEWSVVSDNTYLYVEAPDGYVLKECKKMVNGLETRIYKFIGKNKM